MHMHKLARQRTQTQTHTTSVIYLCMCGVRSVLYMQQDKKFRKGRVQKVVTELVKSRLDGLVYDPVRSAQVRTRTRVVLDGLPLTPCWEGTRSRHNFAVDLCSALHEQLGWSKQARECVGIGGNTRRTGAV